MKEIVIASAARTAVGDFGGSLAGFTPTQLGVVAATAAIERAGISSENVQQSFFGNVIHTEPRDMYVSRTISIEAGIPDAAPALTVNRLCGSGLQAIVSGIQAIGMDDADIVLAGGTECRSRAAHILPSARSGQKMGDTIAVDMMTAALHVPFGHGHMGVTAENIAAKFGISREDQDAFAIESHRRAALAVAHGYFEEQIVPVSVTTRKEPREFRTDEHVRADAKLEDMSRLRAVFQKDGSVTAGNASGINDGASAVVLMTRGAAEARDAPVLARVVTYGHAGVAPKFMGMGPVPAMQNALSRAGLSVDDLDVVESNEAFAAQACAVTAELKLDPAKVNPNGGAVAIGHPIGASGAIITTKLLYELKRTGGRYGAATMCIGGGQGIALIVENVAR